MVPHEGVLSPAELEEVARSISERPDIWERLVRVDAERRRYELVYEDERMDAWVLSWMPGQATGFHDHDVSGVGLAVARGTVREDWMRYGGDSVERQLRPGDARHGAPGYIHRVQHLEGEPAVTVHVYSPRLDRVGQYRVDDDGIVRREMQPGRRELTAQLVASRTLAGALERF
jgi:predicted metal-dependent enzyme (double-stranded beta helix superfamily)